MSTHFWYGKEEEDSYLINHSAKFNDNRLTRTPSDQDPWEYGKTAEITSLTENATTLGSIVNLYGNFNYSGNGTYDRSIRSGPDLWYKVVW